jgi:hypothetical protein
MRVFRYILAASLIIVIGCASLGEHRQLDMLEQRTKNYEAALRWGRYEIIGAFIKSEVTTHLTENLDGLKQIKITSYEVIGRNVLDNNEEAEQKVKIKFYNMDSLIEKTIIDKQIWFFDKDMGNWFLSSGLPDFK